MPVTHQTTFSVRYYECDAYGHLNNAVYLRYMQEAAFNASAALGYGQERYAQLGRLWLARLSEVEYLLPVQYGDRVVVTTWVEDVRRVRSIRAYDFRLESTGEQVARGWTDWIYVEAATGRPSSVPAEIAAVYRPEGGHLEGDSRRHFKDPPAPPPQVFTHHRQVEWQDLDPMQHVNNSVYLDYMVEAAWRFGDAIGWPWQRAQAAGFGVVARRTQIEYLHPAAYADELEIATWLSPPQRATIERHFTMRRLSDGVQIARANSLYVCIDLVSGRARRIPEDFLGDILPYISANFSLASNTAQPTSGDNVP
jgi:acyl-CoA thioester hydrolase